MTTDIEDVPSKRQQNQERLACYEQAVQDHCRPTTQQKVCCPSHQPHIARYHGWYIVDNVFQGGQLRPSDLEIQLKPTPLAVLFRKAGLVVTTGWSASNLRAIILCLTDRVLVWARSGVAAPDQRGIQTAVLLGQGQVPRLATTRSLTETDQLVAQGFCSSN